MQPHPAALNAHHSRRGMSLAEVLVSSMLLSLLAIGSLTTVGAISMSRGKMNDRLKAYDLAEQMLSEVLQARYEVDLGGGILQLPIPLGGGGGNRMDFTIVDDFDGWDASPPEDRSGSPLPGYSGWRRQVSVKLVEPGSLALAFTDKGLKHITVRVTDPSGKILELVALRSKYGAVEQSPTRDSSIVTWVGVNLQIGKESPVTVSGTNLVNHAHDQN